MSSKAILMVAVVAVIAGAGCAIYFMDTEPDWPEDDTQFETKELDAYMFDTDKDKMKKISIRYYEDAPNVPYAKLSQYYELLQREPITATHEGDGIFKLVNHKKHGGDAVLNLPEGKLTSGNYTMFTYITDAYAEEEGASIPFIQTVGSELLNECQEFTLDFKKYGIEIHTDKSSKEIWMPFTTLADMFCGSSNYYAEYVSDAIYFLNSRTIMDKNMYYGDIDFMTRLADSVYTENRPADFVKYNYNELCLLYDHFNGNPGSGLISELLATHGLDYALQNYDDSTRLVRQYLNSSDPTEYLAGLACLSAYLDDGGHTNSSVWLMSVLMKIYSDHGDESRQFILDVQAKIDAISPPTPKDRQKLMADLAAIRDAAWSGMEILGEGARYYVQGDTAVFSFNEFSADTKAWTKYYEEDGDLPEDAIGYLYTALRKADADSNVKKFVIDLTTNSGGYVAEVMFINSLMTAQDTTLTQFNVSTKEVGAARIMSDVNLDRVFDEKDHEKQFRFDFGILTSTCSYSSGNMLPVISQRDGIMILGETSGGGVCSLAVAASADGLVQTMSSTDKVVVGYGEPGYDENTVERGATPDKVLVTYLSNGDIDYSKLYDLDAISKAMDEFYAEA